MGMLEGQIQFVIGVDTHRDTHTAAVCDPTGAMLVHATCRPPAPGTGSCWAWPSARRRVPGCGRWRARAASVLG
jgi:hypothetical protein